MKKIIYILLLCFFTIEFSYAAVDQSSRSISPVSLRNQPVSEENKCFELLNQAVTNDSRMSDIDLSSVLLDEQSQSRANLSFYERLTASGATGSDGFMANRSINPEFSGVIDDSKHYFFARRTNIATIVAGSDFVVSQIVGFGKKSNFDFPLTSKIGRSFGDKYVVDGNNFTENLLYTHHLKYSGDFLSCGMVHVKPLGENTYGTISENNYYTNILNTAGCSSGFEGQIVGGGEYYQMKSNICVNDYDDKPLLKLELISIAYDNRSRYFNEFEIFPLQVRAMKNSTNNKTGLAGIRKNFLDSVYRNTNLRLIGSRSFQRTGIFKRLFSFVVPDAEAKLDVSMLDDNEEPPIGMMTGEGFPYSLDIKLDEIPDKKFVEYIRLAISPSLDDIIKKRKDSGLELSPYEETFIACGIDYKTRLNIVIDFLEKLDVKHFDINNLSYSNKRFGDCIIPYPDKEHIGKEFNYAFASNKLNAQKLNQNYISEDIPSMREYQEKISILESDYMNSIKDLEAQFSSGSLSFEDFQEKKAMLDKQFSDDVEMLQNSEPEELAQTGAVQSIDDISQIKGGEQENLFSKYRNYFMFGGLILLGLLLLYIAYRIKSNTTNTKKTGKE